MVDRVRASVSLFTTTFAQGSLQDQLLPTSPGRTELATCPVVGSSRPLVMLQAAGAGGEAWV